MEFKCSPDFGTDIDQINKYIYELHHNTYSPTYLATYLRNISPILAKYYSESVMEIDKQLINYISSSLGTDMPTESFKNIALLLYIEQLTTILKICSRIKRKPLKSMPFPSKLSVPPHLSAPSNIKTQKLFRKYYTYIIDDSLKIDIPNEIFNDVASDNILFMRTKLLYVLELLISFSEISFINDQNNIDSYKNFITNIQTKKFDDTLLQTKINEIISRLTNFQNLHNFLRTPTLTIKQLIIFLVTYYLCLGDMLKQKGGNIYDLFYRWKYEKYKLLNYILHNNHE